MDELMKQAEDHLAKGRVQIATDEAIHNIKSKAVDLRQQILENIAHYGQENTKTLLMYEAAKLLGEVAALSSNAAQSAGQRPYGWIVKGEFVPFSMERADGLFSGRYSAEHTPIYTHPSSAAQVVPWDMFPGWLIDHCEGEILTEERMQAELSNMLNHLKTAAPSKGEE